MTNETRAILERRKRFEAISKLPASSRDVLVERERQVEAEGWSTAHDDGHEDGEIAAAAACYAAAAAEGYELKSAPPWAWPFSAEWWKPAGQRRNLVKAGALILAEIERLDRAAPPQDGEAAGAMTERLTDEALEAIAYGGVVISQARLRQIARELIDARGEVDSIEAMFSAGQGDDDGSQVLPDFEDGMTTSAKVEDCLHLLEKRRDVIESPDGFHRRATPADDLRAAAIGPRAAYMTCRGCPAHRKTDWSDPSGDGETMDRGTVNNCGAADGRCIDGSYGSISPMPPVWCPAALSQNGGA